MRMPSDAGSIDVRAFAMPIDDAAQCRARDELHGDEVVARHFAQLIDLDDVPVKQVRREFRFVDEKLKELRALRVMRVDDLERDALREARWPELLRLVHRRHAALGNLIDEFEGAVIVEVAIRVKHRRALSAEREGGGGAGARAQRERQR